jgi:hypothetical protein
LAFHAGSSIAADRIDNPRLAARRNIFNDQNVM